MWKRLFLKNAFAHYLPGAVSAIRGSAEIILADVTTFQCYQKYSGSPSILFVCGEQLLRIYIMMQDQELAEVGKSQVRGTGKWPLSI